MIYNVTVHCSVTVYFDATRTEGVLASLKTVQEVPTELGYLLARYRLYTRSEGKGKNSIDIGTNSISYLGGFLRSQGSRPMLLRLASTR